MNLIRAIKVILAILAATLLLRAQTEATPITGSIEFAGSTTASGPSGGAPVTMHFIDPWQTVAGSGSYAGIPAETATMFNDLSFIGDGIAATLLGPDMPIWTFTIGATTYSFDLAALTNGHVGAGMMDFSGTGIAHITGFDDIPASFALQGAGTNFDFILSSSTTATSTPEGGTTLAMLGLALLVIGVVRRTVKVHSHSALQSACLRTG
jgi:hypothetical protein